ncbi:MAG TPA: hypothetical protein VND15_03335 [Candidatus Acidoferrales bacterium]|nr:hypothetical protein [Candidatus Acidoferrales bacterium]
MTTEITKTGLTEAKVAELRRRAEGSAANARSQDKAKLYKAAASEFLSAAVLYAQVYKSTKSREDLALSTKHYLEAGLSFNAHGSFVGEKIKQGMGRGVYTNRDFIDSCESAIHCFTKAKDKARAEAARSQLTSGTVSSSVSELRKHSRTISSALYIVNETLEITLKGGIDIRKNPTSERSVRWALRSLESSSKELHTSIANAKKLLGKEPPK